MPDSAPLQVHLQSYDGFTVDRFGTVHRWHEDKDGREDSWEPLAESPVRDVFPAWIWEGFPNA